MQNIPGSRLGLTRRQVLSVGASAGLVGMLPGLASTPGYAARDSVGAAPQVPGVKALTFDVFGTVVDWHSSIIREGQRLGEERDMEVDTDCGQDQVQLQ